MLKFVILAGIFGVLVKSEFKSAYFKKLYVTPMKDLPMNIFRTKSRVECSTHCLMKQECMYFRFNKTFQNCSLYDNYTAYNEDSSFKIQVYVNTIYYDSRNDEDNQETDNNNTINCHNKILQYRPELADDTTFNWNINCEMIDSETWFLIQRRLDGSVNFNQTWENYKVGFGSHESEFWLGNEKISLLTEQDNVKVKFEMWDESDNYGHAEYSYFKVRSSDEKYKLSIHSYVGNAGDEMSQINDSQFSTYDADNDYNSNQHCAMLRGMGGWWFNECNEATLNAQYLTNGNMTSTMYGMKWPKFTNKILRRTQIKIAFKDTDS